MTCGGCTPPPAGFAPRDLAAICQLCDDAARDNPAWALSPARGCGVSGASMTEITLYGRPCPRGLHPTSGRPWLDLGGLSWLGVPWPNRWLLWALGCARPSAYSGCGCVKAWRELWERVGAWVRGLRSA